jgi:hypothetical protein
VSYLPSARSASEYGYAVAFVAVTLISLVGLAAAAWLVRRPPPEIAESGAGARLDAPQPEPA